MGRISERQIDLAALLIQEALREGFPVAGVVDIELAFQSGKIQPHVEQYDRWLEKGKAGAMSYLVRGRDRRADPKLVFPEARSILCVAIPYDRRPAGAERGARYARYIQGPDYHDEIARKLEKVMAAAKAAIPSLTWKVCVDTSAVLERSWAALAGLGWIGKNTLLIHPVHGSYLFLGEVLINQATGRAPASLPNYCGNCSRCLSACPTGALAAAGDLDSRSCISYWTLEKRGTLELSDGQKKTIGNWVAGCDLCQEICPFNRKPTLRQLESAPGEASTHDATAVHHWEELLDETIEAYRERVMNSALSRIKPAQFSRNLAIALGNSAASLDSSTRDKLKAKALQRRALEKDESALREWDRCVSLLSESNPV